LLHIVAEGWVANDKISSSVSIGLTNPKGILETNELVANHIEVHIGTKPTEPTQHVQVQITTSPIKVGHVQVQITTSPIKVGHVQVQISTKATKVAKGHGTKDKGRNELEDAPKITKVHV